MSEKPMILLLGRRDQPTDGVLDYCQMLRDAGTQREPSFELVSVPWAERGWRGPHPTERRRQYRGGDAGFYRRSRRWRDPIAVLLWTLCDARSARLRVESVFPTSDNGNIVGRRLICGQL
jgi:hypothetical protein